MSKALTNIEDFLGAYKEGNNDSFENRNDLYPYMRKAMQYAASGQVLPADVLAEYKKHGWDETQAIKYPLIDNLVTTINTGKLATCSASVTQIDTAFGTVTSVFYNWEFTMAVVDSYINSVGYANEFKTKFESGSRGLAEIVNALVNTNVEAVANTYFPAALQTAYWPDNVAADAFLIPNTGIPRIYNNLQGVMREMNMDTETSNWDVLCTTPHFTEVVDLLNQGSGNDTNTGYQFGPFNFEMEKDLAIGEATSGQAAMVMVPNTFGIWNVNAPDVVMNGGSNTTDGKQWKEVTEPLTGMNVGSLFSSTCTNATALESFQYYTGVTFVSKYNSDPSTRYSPWLKLEIEA